MRPCKTYPGVRTRYADVDLVIMRETTEDIYAGIEFEQGTPAAEELRGWLEAHGERLPQPDSGISIKPISITGTRRVFEFAFEYARAMGRRKITAVHKANIMKFTDGLWLHEARRSPPAIPISSSKTGSLTTCACSSSNVPRSTT